MNVTSPKKGFAMIERMLDLPNNVVGFTASGEVTAEDYEAVLVPAIEEVFRSTKKARLLYVFGKDFKSYTGAAAWEDAKVGLKHLTQFDRVAVVTDTDWIKTLVKAFGFVMPCEVRVFAGEDLSEAHEWILAPAPAGNLSFEFLREQGVLVLRPKGKLDAADFKRVSAAIAPYLEQEGASIGVMIVAERFPGWDGLAAFLAHLRFVEEHRKRIARLAIVTDDTLLSALQHIASHLVVTEARRYRASEEGDALAWVSGRQARA